MNSKNGEITGQAKAGRPPVYLLSGIASCGVCGSKTRIGRQNTGVGRRMYGKLNQPMHYRVYECAGNSASSGFHVSMRQDHLDQIVTEAVLARVAEPDFQPPPHDPGQDADGTEREALRLEIEKHSQWLDGFREEAKKRKMFYMIQKEERIVLPQIAAAQARIEELERLDPITSELATSQSARTVWDAMPMAQRRHVVASLMKPKINPVAAGEHGKRGLNPSRVDLNWHAQLSS